MGRTARRFATVLAIAGLASACTSTKLAGSIDGEPVCADFKIGGNEMKGSLRYPVKVTIFEDVDDDALWERLVFARRKAEDKSTIFAIADSDAEYVVRWAQCPNPFAPKPVDSAAKTTDHVGGYSCGEAKAYEDTKLVIKEGDANSRKMTWVVPPEADCWTSDGPSPDTSASASASAPTPPPPAPPEPSSAPSADASASASASGAPSAAPAPPAPAPAPAPADPAPAPAPAAPAPPAPQPEKKPAP